MEKKLYRSNTTRVLGGVCGGISQYFGIDPWLVRILCIICGVGILIYFLFWAFLPVNPDPAK